MNITNRATKTLIAATKRVHASRSYASSSRFSQQAEKHANKEATHDDHHEHHDHNHPMWEGPFRKPQTGLLIFGGGLLAVTLIVGATLFQQKKQGYWK